MAKRMNDQAMKEAAVWRVCERHKKPLKFFCKDDEATLCATCTTMKRHKTHHVLLVEDAAEDDKQQISSCLENLRKKKVEILESKADIEEQTQDMFDTIERERQRIMAAFAFLREFLEKEEGHQLTQMGKMDREVAKQRNEIIDRLLEEMASLENTIQKLEAKCENPPGDLLKDTKGMLERCEQKQKENFENPLAFPPTLKWRVWEFWAVGPGFEKVMKNFEATLKSISLQHKENMALDKKTICPQLRISEDGKCLTCCNRRHRGLVNTGRFIHYQGVLGSKCFRSGRHCWDVEVGKEDGWDVGVCILPFQYNNYKAPGPEAGFWAIGKWDGCYRAVIHPHHPPLELSEEPSKIRVSLNYLGQQVSFFDADTADLLYSFSLPDHCSSAYYPFFGLWSKSCLRLYP